MSKATSLRPSGLYLNVVPSNKKPTPPTKTEQWNKAYDEAIMMLETYDGLEIRSALKQAGSDHGISWGDDMGAFVAYAEKRMGL
jgi:hypothetical protein